MPVVRSPSFEDLVKIHGNRRAAVQHLLDSGFRPEEIEWKMGVPYHLIRLLIAGAKLTNPTLFFSVVKTYERLALLQSRKGKETELSRFFKREDLPLEMKIRLALGKPTDESLKVGPGIVERATSIATGRSIDEVRQLLIDYGEHGEVASLLKMPSDASLTAEEVLEAIRILPRLTRISERTLLISSLLRAGTPEEARYIVRMILGDLKLGYYQSTVIRAVARAYNVPIELIERATAILGRTEGLMLAPEGHLMLSEIKLRPGRFLKPQLAHLYDPDKVSYPVVAEHKYDGSRLQIHRWGTKIWLFSRRGIEKSQALPEVVEIAQHFKAQSCIVDSEVVAVDEKGVLQPFQRLLKRTVPRKPTSGELEQRRRGIGVTIRAFDILFLNGRQLTNLPLLERRKHLFEVVPLRFLAESRDCKDEVEVMRFYEESLNAGLEGIMVKSLSSIYSVGERAYTWLKLKPERDTVDCTIVKALFGKGKRVGLYSSFLLAIRDSKEKKLYTIGKVSNLSERSMEALRDIVNQTRLSEDQEGVFVKPTVVVEATYQEIQKSDNYTSGFALRVPKIVRFRLNKKVEEIDVLEKLRKLYELQYEKYVSRAS